MSEFYEYESSCSRCLRSSPLASLLAMIVVFLGGTAFGVGVIFGRKRLYELLAVDQLFPYLDYTVYAIVGATGLFVIIVYVICAISSGWNAKRCFEGSRATCCGRCLNSSLLVCLVIAVIFWVLVACLLAFNITSISLLMYRSDGPARSLHHNGVQPLNREARQAVEEAFYPPPGYEDHDSLPGEVFDPSTKPYPTRGGLDVDPSAVIADYFACPPDKIDLSYYGLYGTDGKPLMLDANNTKDRFRDTLIFSVVAFFGALLTMFGFLLLTCFVAANYARLKEQRYYEPSENGDETIRLRH